ncbi:MAG TPA: TlpA disulfide reductase family protein [Pirellulales bacterium]|nr:TlpA disulfide reductase family protein [Pirellulales bacterium]
MMTDFPPLPRYQFEIGQELNYLSTSKFCYEGGEEHAVVEWNIWPLARNDDGSWRILQRERIWHGADLEAVLDKADDRCANLIFFDMFPDGHTVMQPCFETEIDPRQIFPRLPSDVRAFNSDWQGFGPMDEKHTYRVECGARGSAKLSIQGVKTSPVQEVDLATAEATYQFNVALRLVDQVNFACRQEYGFAGTVTGSTVLVSADRRDAAWVALLRQESEAYFAAAEEHRKRVRRATRCADEAKRLLAEARCVWGALAGAVAHPVFKSQANARLKSHDSITEQVVDESQRRAQTIGQQGPEFCATDLDGRRHSLRDYRGRIVVLDFWYRGCGWCLRAMPQINELARSLENRPVVVLGVSVDRDVSDTRSVAEKLRLVYPCLSAMDLAERFHVRGFPTVVVIDKKGIVRDRYVGYTPTFAAEIAAQIERLLAED